VEEDKGPKNIYDFRTLTGEIEIEQRNRATRFCDYLGPFSKAYERINSIIARTAKKLQFRSHELADDYFAIGAEINHFVEVLKAAEIP